MRILFVGAVEFSRHCLKNVLENEGNVVAVLTLPKEKALFHSDYADLSSLANHYEIPVHKLDKNINNPENIELIRTLKPDVIFVFGWSQLISREIVNIPPLGCIGTHPALLPRNRGRHPIVWALVEGLEESGLTFFYIDEGTDSGDILWQKPFPINLEDDARSLYEKIKRLATEAIQVFLPQLKQGTAPRIPQDNSKATYWRKRTSKDGEIRWTAPTMQIYNLIRALSRPYVGAHTYLNSEKVLIWRARILHAPVSTQALTLQPGEVFAEDDAGFDIRTGDGHLKILKYELLGGRKIRIGDRLGYEL